MKGSYHPVLGTSCLFFGDPKSCWFSEAGSVERILRFVDDTEGLHDKQISMLKLALYIIHTTLKCCQLHPNFLTYLWVLRVVAVQN